MKFPLLAALASATLLTPLLADITSWRNNGNGLYPSANPALSWDGKDLWNTPLPDRSNACPIIVGDKIFLTAETAQLLCLDRKTGKIFWNKSNAYADVLELPDEVRTALKEEKERAESSKDKLDPLNRELYKVKRSIRRKPDDQELKKRARELNKQIAEIKGAPNPLTAKFKTPPAHDVNGYSSYTPVSDGKHVFASFGIGVVVSYDLDGNLQWASRLDNPDHSWGGASSPILAGNTLVVRFADWVGLDPNTGKEKWRVPTDIIFNCPAIFQVEGQDFLYTGRGQLIRANDGKLLPSQNFEQDVKPWAFFNTPSVIDGHIYTVHGNEGGTGQARSLKIPATIADLEKNGLQEVWMKDVNKNRYYSSPLVHNGNVYIISREYVLQALDAKTGNVHYEQRLKGLTGTAYPSLTLAGDNIFVGAEDGNALFFKPGNTYEELSRTSAHEFRSTPVFINNITYLRTQESLRAIEAP